MKKWILCSLVLVLSGLLTQAIGQEKNYVLSTANPRYVPAIITTANTIAEQEAAHLGKIEIVLYGAAVKNLDQAETTTAWLDLVQHSNIAFKACNIALRKQQVDKSQLPKQFDVVANAFVYILKLKEKGYYALDL